MGLDLFGLPEEEDSTAAIEVDPAKLVLVSWEWLLPREATAIRRERTTLGPALGAARRPARRNDEPVHNPAS